MERAVITISIGNSHGHMAGLTLPLMEEYSRKIGAEFIPIREGRLHLGHPAYEKFQLFDWLDRFERVLFLDHDVIVRQNCPDLFAEVPSDRFGAFLVHEYTRHHDHSISRIQEQLGNIAWQREYFNTGVVVASRCHQEAFRLPEVPALGRRFFLDQTQINYNVQKLRIPIFDIGYRFNHTTAPNNSDKRFESFIIHYPGPGHRLGGKLEQIYRDMLDLGMSPSLDAGATRQMRVERIPSMMRKSYSRFKRLLSDMG